MNRYQKLMLGFLLLISLACGSLQIQSGAPSLPTSVPGAVNTYIAQTAEAAFTQTASAAPPTFTPTSTSTSTPTLVVTETPLPTISVHIEQANLDSNSLLIVGQLIGTLAETGYRSVATLSLFDSQKNKLLEQEAPCVETPNEAEKLCIFVFSISELPAKFANYEIMGQIHLSNGLILTGQMASSFAEGETQANVIEDSATQVPSSSPQPIQPAVSISKSDVSVHASFSSLFYRPENGSSVSASATYFGDSAVINASNVKLCVSIVEQRRYQSGKSTQVVLTDECKAVYFSGSDKLANASAEFFFKPSGYSFILTDSPDGRYQILDVRAVVTVEQNQQVLATSAQSHRPVPVRVINTSLHTNSQASATVEALAGQGQTYNLALRVYQIEGDPDETFWSSILLFIPCLLPEVCDDRERIGESVQPIELIPGANVPISTSYSAVPVSEEGNFITGYEMVVYFEDIIIGRK